ncbi:LPS-assembly protein LptD [Falsirhodobacter sp. alg1]|uniref:LPS-assembly protein LptD n=1 Tax=Falsirhodobacter sp. alg1 TaxID=1472418 RepID=UPI0005F0B2EA|nr:LPS assembly protein LptD [Falsirhodobacter sp. alg1]
MRLRAALFALAVTMPAAPALAQDQATLVADDLRIQGNNVLNADGNVEIFYQGQRLRASSVQYDRAKDSLLISGPITLDDGQGAILLADQAELSGDMTNGILRSARVVLNNQLQLAASEVNRIGDRYTRLGRSVASSCQICATNPTPLWEIRAKEIIHDQQERQIYFENAQLRVYGVPIAYIPRLRMPDPTVTRSSGVLQPSVRTTSDFGTGIKIPYFFALGESRDLTITPYYTTKNTRSVDIKYRQAFNSGWIEFNGASSTDELVDGQRGYILATGEFKLPDDYVLKLRVDTVSDDTYMDDYGLEERDRLESSAEATRTRRNEYISGRIINFQSLRDGEPTSTIPSQVADATLHRRFTGGPLGGEAGLEFQVHSATRTSHLDYDTDDDDDDIADGRDTQRASVRLDWRRNYVLPAGILGTTMGELAGDIYNIDEDAEYEGTYGELNGSVGVEFRWPWVRNDSNGTSQILSPIAQLVWSPSDSNDVPNEDSTLVEFDETNLFSLNRYSGYDAYERGARMNLGLQYTRVAASGWSFGTIVGRTFRDSDLDQFTAASGLDGKTSDWMTQFQIIMGEGLVLTNRTLFDDTFDVTKSEMRMDSEIDLFTLSASYVYIMADATEDRDDDLSEMNFSGSYKINDAWKANASTRYDFVLDRAASASVGAEFSNECLSVDLYLSRHYSSSSSVDPTTEFGLSVDLLGFGSKSKPGPTGTCRS